MELEEIKSVLETDGKADLFEKIVAVVEAEKAKGIDISRKKNQENASLRRYKQAIDQLGYTDDMDIAEFVGSISNKKSSDSLTLKSLQTQITELKNERDTYAKKAAHSGIRSKLQEALNDKVYGADLLISNLINDGKVVLENDQIMYKKDEDTVLGLEDGIKHILETRKDLLKNNQNAGAGSKKSTGSNSTVESIIASGDKDAIAANIKEIAKLYNIKL